MIEIDGDREENIVGKDENAFSLFPCFFQKAYLSQDYLNLELCGKRLYKYKTSRGKEKILVTRNFPYNVFPSLFF